jgi:high-affinity iron transporter
LAAFAGQLAGLFEGTGQELFNAGVLLAAVAMLTWHNVWMASHGRALAEGARQLGAAVAAGRKPLAALSVICGTALLREGSETVLFLYGVAASGDAPASMLAGALIGLLPAVALSCLVYLGLLAVPVRHLFAVTAVLVTLLAAGLAAQSVAYLQQAGHLEVLTATVWDSSWLLPEDGLAGRLLHTLVGYTDRPSGAQLAAYLLVVGAIAALTWLVRQGASAGSGHGAGAASPSSS